MPVISPSEAGAEDDRPALLARIGELDAQVAAFRRVTEVQRGEAAAERSRARKAEDKLLGQMRVLEMAATGAPLLETIDALIHLIEAQEPGMRAGILIVTECGGFVEQGRSPTLPQSFYAPLGGLPITPPYKGSCGEAAHKLAAISVSDVSTETRYPDGWRENLLSYGIQAVRSTPVRSSDGRVLASFAMHYDHPRNPDPADPQLIGIATHLAAIVLEHHRVLQRLHDHRAELERLVDARTAELMRESDERRRVEEALRQAEKLAALRQLTGGVAHDFNNLLQVVSSGAALLKRPGMAEARRDTVLDSLIQAGERGRELTARLLAFARRQPLAPESFDLNMRLLGMSELIRQTLGARVEVRPELAFGLRPAYCDPSQLEVAVLNLVANARDAMPEGGTLTLRTATRRLEAAPDRPAGKFVCLTVADTGTGMRPSVLARAFEPFFTTKPLNEGTGLGLPQVFGFAKQSGGDVIIESEPDKGTAVSVMLPIAPSMPVGAPDAAAVLAALQSSDGQTVLVVEDNKQAGDLAAILLEELGYRTLRADSGDEAVALLARGERVDAVFSDIVMPGRVSGIELAEIVRQSYPDVAVVLATGYSAKLAGGRAASGVETLGKPYRLDEIAGALQRALPGTRPSSPSAWS